MKTFKAMKMFVAALIIIAPPICGAAVYRGGSDLVPPATPLSVAPSQSEKAWAAPLSFYTEDQVSGGTWSKIKVKPVSAHDKTALRSHVGEQKEKEKQEIDAKETMAQGKPIEREIKYSHSRRLVGHDNKEKEVVLTVERAAIEGETRVQLAKGEKEQEAKKIAYFPEIKKINEELYIGKVAQNLYVAMEKVTPDTIDMWEYYGTQQSHNIISNTFPSDGIGVFTEILSRYKKGKIDPSLNELWVAYISDIPVNKKIILKDTNRHIKMVVAVLTSSEALITTHLGISRTFESFKEGVSKVKGVSIPLHSFAAKVMKQRCPNKIYMFTGPTTRMREIILLNMPLGSVFIGDNVYKDIIEKRYSNRPDLYKEQYDLLRTHPPRIIKKGLGLSTQFTFLKDNNEPVVTFESSSLSYQWIFGFSDLFAPSYVSDFALVLVDLEVLANASPLIVLEPTKDAP